MFYKFLDKIQILRQHSFVKNAFWLQGASALGTFIQGLAGVLIARFLQPENFGIFSLAFGMASVASIFLGVGAQEALTPLVARSHTQGDRTLLHSAWSYLYKLVLSAAIFTLTISFLLPFISNVLYENSAIGQFAQIIVLASAISSIFFSPTSLFLQIANKIKSLAIFTFMDQVLRYSLSISLVILGLGIWGAVGGHVIGAALISFCCLVIWRSIHHRHPEMPTFIATIKGAINVPWKFYLGGSIWATIDRNMAMLFSALPIVLTGLFVTVTEVTYFRLAFGYLTMGMGLLIPVSVLLNVEFAKLQVSNPAKIRGRFIKISLAGMALSAGITFGLIIFAPVVFKYLFGEIFSPSIEYVNKLVVYGIFMGLGVGLGPMWRAINKVKVSIVINLITLGVGVPLGLFLIKNWGLTGSTMMITIWIAASHTASFLYLSRNINRLNGI